MFVVAVVSVGLLVLTIVLVEARARVRRTERFRDLAHRLDAHFEEPSALLGYPGGRHALEAVIEQAVVRLEVLLADRYERVTCTRARARFALGAGPRFTVVPRGLFSGGPNEPLGDEQGVYVLRAEDPARARALWTPRARRLASALERVTVESDGTTVTVVIVKAEHDVRVLEALVELAGELASHGMHVLLPLAELPGARLVRPRGGWYQPRAAHVEVAGAGGIVRIAALPGRAGPQLALTLDDARERRPFSVRIEGGQLLDEAPRGSIPPSAAALLEPLGSATLLGNDEWLRLVFASVPPDDAVHAGVRLLFELVASTARGVFR
jgi:hypothetical protein